MSRYVVDASVALKWVLPEEDSLQARAVLLESIVAPDWWLVEAGNGLWKAASRKQLSVDEATTALARLRTAPVEPVSCAALLLPALSLASRLGHPIYDCLYLALAIDLDLPLITADERFRRTLKQDQALAARVILLSDFALRLNSGA